MLWEGDCKIILKKMLRNCEGKHSHYINVKTKHLVGILVKDRDELRAVNIKKLLNGETVLDLTAFH